MRKKRTFLLMNIIKTFGSDKNLKSLEPKNSNFNASNLGWKENLSEIDKRKIRYPEVYYFSNSDFFIVWVKATKNGELAL